MKMGYEARQSSSDLPSLHGKSLLAVFASRRRLNENGL